MTRRRTCFVVCPIGEENSPIRQTADDLFELVIEPALEKYNFDVIRADRIPRTSMITTDVIQLVQTADLCIIDLSGHNPNVFYECGRRHETGKPYIHLLRKGDDRPFDVAGLRDIAYDLSTPRSVHECKVAIQTFIDELERAGFASSGSGESLASVVTAIERVERRLAQLTTTTSTGIGGSSVAQSYEDILGNPVTGFADALASGDLANAERYLARLEYVLGIGDSLLQKAALLAPSGSALAVRIIERCVAGDITLFPLDSLKLGVALLINYAFMLDREADALPTIEPLIEHIIAAFPDMSNQDQGYLMNQLGRLNSAAGNVARGIEFEEKAASLSPEEPTYLYNLSLNYEKLGMDDKAFEAVQQYAALSNGLDDDDRLYQAVDLYAKNGNADRANTLFATLRDKFPGKAKLLLASADHVRRIIRS